MSQFCYICPSIKAANALLSAVQNLGYCRCGYQAIHNMFQYFCILPTRRCSATRLKHSISAGVILHLSLAIMFQASKRDDAGQICQHSTTMYCTCSNSNATKTTTAKEYFWHIIGLEGAYFSTKKWVENSLGQCKGTTRVEGLRKDTKTSFSVTQRFHLTTILLGGPGYGLVGPGIESRRGRDFSHTSRPALGPTQTPVQWVPGFSRG
jgi:hypothetical protein